MNNIQSKIDQMNLAELLFVRYNPETFIANSLSNEIQGNQYLLGQINQKMSQLRNQELHINSNKNMYMQQVGRLKTEIENIKDEINKLLLEKNALKSANNKQDFIRSLEKEVKDKLTSPEFLFKELTQEKITFDEFNKKYKELVDEGNYYYYKVIADKLREMN